jgi:transposase
MNTQRMSEFLDQVAQRHPRDFIVMVVDGASSHRGKDLIVPENIRLLPLPAYSPELNPQEHLWDEIREKEFPNRVFDSLDGVKKQLRSGLVRLARDGNRVSSITAWPWIVTLILKAT